MSPRTKEQFETIRKERKEEILEAALHVFSEQGYHSASISKISQRAKISKGLMYNYFESKEDLLNELLDDVMEKVLVSVGINASETLDDEKIIKYINRSFEIVDQDRLHWKLYFSVMTQPNVMEISMSRMIPKIEPFIRAMIQYFETKGNPDPVSTMRYFSASIDGIQMQYLFDPDNFPIENVKKQLIEQFVKS